jgi:hypothetical protein
MHFSYLSVQRMIQFAILDFWRIFGEQNTVGEFHD